MRSILICCLAVVITLFLIPSAFAVDEDNSNNFSINIKTLDDTATITEIAIPKGSNEIIELCVSKLSPKGSICWQVGNFVDKGVKKSLTR